jgi:hypothetical protein
MCSAFRYSYAPHILELKQSPVVLKRWKTITIEIQLAGYRKHVMASGRSSSEGDVRIELSSHFGVEFTSHSSRVARHPFRLVFLSVL